MALTAGTLNSVTISGTTATLNVTPAVDAAYSLTQPLYKIKGNSNWSLGATYVGTQGVAGNTNITGLTVDTLYEFEVLTADSSGRYSLPSASIPADGTTRVSENNLFVANAITLLANSTQYISWVGAVTVEAARLRTHNKQLDYVVDQLYFPCACVYFQSDSSNQIDTDNFLRNVPIKIQFLKEVDSDPQRNISVIATEFMTSVGKIIDELQDMRGVDTYLDFKSIDMPNTPSISDPYDDKDGPKSLIEITITLQAGF